MTAPHAAEASKARLLPHPHPCVTVHSDRHWRGLVSYTDPVNPEQESLSQQLGERREPESFPFVVSFLSPKSIPATCWSCSCSGRGVEHFVRVVSCVAARR